MTLFFLVAMRNFCLISTLLADSKPLKSLFCFNNEIVHFLLRARLLHNFDINVDSADLLVMLIICGLRIGGRVGYVTWLIYGELFASWLAFGVKWNPLSMTINLLITSGAIKTKRWLGVNSIKLFVKSDQTFSHITFTFPTPSDLFLAKNTAEDVWSQEIRVRSHKTKTIIS